MSKRRQIWLHQYLGQFGNDIRFRALRCLKLDLLRQLSPIYKIDQVKAPVIVLHGDHDTNVPIDEAEQVVAALKARHIPVNFVVFPGEGHGWQKISTRVDSNVAVTEWFRKYLQVPVESVPTHR